MFLHHGDSNWIIIKLSAWKVIEQRLFKRVGIGMQHAINILIVMRATNGMPFSN
jgi:hypothetical protein